MLGTGRQEATPWTSVGWAGVVTILVPMPTGVEAGTEGKEEERKKENPRDGILTSHQLASSRQGQ